VTRPRNATPPKSDGWSTISVRMRVETVKAWRKLSPEEKASAAGKLRAIVRRATEGKEP